MKIMLAENLVVLMLDNVGILGFDYSTGKKLFSID
jgi:hypothetical protein